MGSKVIVMGVFSYSEAMRGHLTWLPGLKLGEWERRNLLHRESELTYYIFWTLAYCRAMENRPNKTIDYRSG
jgi:hypothetical protein